MATRRLTALSLLLTVVSCLWLAPVGAAQDGTGVVVPDGRAANDPTEKLSTDLLRVYHAVRSGEAIDRHEPLRNAIGEPVTDYVVVDVVARGGDSSALLADLEMIGLLEGSAFGAVVSGRLPLEALGAAAELPRVASIASSLALTGRIRNAGSSTRTGSVTGQSDRAVLADVARATYGITGAGIRMGILSDSFDTQLGAADDIGTGDLPADIIVLQEFTQAASDEGRAMMQLAFNIAPEITFAFHTAFLGQASFAQGIVALADAGSQIIVDDVIYLAEPMFQDGIIAQAVDQVVQRNHAYFSSAGNSADESYEAPFRDAAIDADYTIPDFPVAGEAFSISGRLHDFDPSPDVVDPFHQVVLPANREILLSFQWDQPFRAADPQGLTGSASDYAILLVDAPSPTANVVAFSAANNVVTGNPAEVFRYINVSGGAQTLYMVIVLREGPEAGLMKWVEFRRAATFEYVTRGAGVSTTYGHSNAAGAFATGAAAWFNTPAWDDTLLEPVINGFSSYGGTPILFDVPGNRLAQPLLRAKPDVVGSDGDSNTFFGSPDVNGDGWPNFFGTSASAPNVAAVGALMLEASDGALTPPQMYSLLRSTADDIRDIQGRNRNTAPGYDRRSGFGFVRADRAVASATAIPPGPGILSSAFPNPFRQRTTLVFTVEQAQTIRAAVYNTMGQRVALLFEGAAAPEAPVNLTFAPAGLASGVYVVRVVGETFTASRRVTVIR